ncbi:MAG: SOS response-associated peptidase [Peptococcaceae bacterium]|jgi:putative SOS response-associated peptidase YedK|nr:SOS response-associated peptidase [Peptococcaceae bacterium]
MCGRFTLTGPTGAVAGHFQAVPRFQDAGPRYNIAPGQDIGVVVNGSVPRQLIAMRWGLVPGWARPGQSGHPLINARAETVIQKPSFREAFRHRRCLVPADGWYEWQRTAGGKIPYRLVCGAGLFALAGIWNPGRNDGEPSTCAVLTTAAAGGILPIHDRMPLILAATGEYAAWLDPAGTPVDLLRTYEGEVSAYRVTTAVNSARVDSPELIVQVN